MSLVDDIKHEMRGIETIDVSSLQLKHWSSLITVVIHLYDNIYFRTESHGTNLWEWKHLEREQLQKIYDFVKPDVFDFDDLFNF